MSVVTQAILDRVLSVKTVTERSILKTVRVQLNADIKDAKATARENLEIATEAARSNFRNAIRNRKRGEALEQMMTSTDLSAEIATLRLTSAKTLADTLEALRSDADAVVCELLDRYDAGEFNAKTSKLPVEVATSAEVVKVRIVKPQPTEIA